MSYRIEAYAVLVKAHRLMSLFLGHKEVVSRSISKRAPRPDDLLTMLHDLVFATEASSLLIEIGASLRVLDDQFKRMEPSDPTRIAYQGRMERAEKELADGGVADWSMRDLFNKIIHAERTLLGQELAGMQAGGDNPGYFLTGGLLPSPRRWFNLDGNVTFLGHYYGKPWQVTFSVDVFVRAVCRLLMEVGDPEAAGASSSA